MTREQAIALARKHAKAKPQSYFAEPFEPHEWVVDAILEAGFQGGLTGLAKAADVLWQDHVSRRHRMTLDELVEAVRDMRQRWVALIQAHGWGDQFDGDIQNLDDAIAALSAEPLSHAWKSGYAQAKEEETPPSPAVRKANKSALCFTFQELLEAHDRLLIELEARDATIKRLQKSHTEAWNQTVRSDNVAALDELDRSRLDWMELHGVEIGVSARPEGSRFARWYRGQGYGDTIRAAIDAAMEQMEAEDSTKLALLFSNDWLRERIASDPDDDPQAGPAVE